jgi:MSHA biogenesis protein MshI
MRLFRKARKTEAWLAMVLQREGIAAASVRRPAVGKPAVTLAAFFSGAPGLDTLEKAGKELHSANFRCTTVLGGGEYQFMSVEAPNVPRAELKTAMRWRLKDVLDFPVDEATYDVLDIPLDPAAAVRPQQSIFAIAARNSVIQARQKLFAKSKIRLRTIDIPEMAQRNVSALLEPDGRGIAMLSFSEDGGLLTVSWRTELYLSRRIDVTLAQLLEPDLERRHQSFDKITLELQRSLDNFDRQFSFISVAKLVLAPSGVDGLQDYLAGNLYTRVETLDLAQVLDVEGIPELADAARQQRLFVAIGAALRSEEDAA